MKKQLLLATLAFGAIHANAQVSAGLISKYSFTNGSAFDEIGSNHGTVVGATPTTDRFGHANMAYSFNGTSNYISVEHHPSIDMNNLGEITISAWIKPNTVSGGLSSIVTKWNGSTSEQYGLWSNGSTNLVAIRVVNTSGVSDAASYATGNWYHVTFSYNKTTNEHVVYVNGVQTLTYTPSGTYGNSTDTTSLSIGAQMNDFNGSGAFPNRFFDGSIDDIRIYDRVLSSAEVDSLYDAEAPVCSGFEVNILQNNPSSGAADGSIVFLPNGGYAPYTYTVNGGSSTSITSSSMCGFASEGGTINMSAPGAAVFTAVNFASYGNSTGSCGAYLINNCHALTSTSVAESTILGTTTFTLGVNNGPFGDPCFGTGKHMNLQVSHAENAVISGLTPGNYTIVITDSLGCTATTTVAVGITSINDQHTQTISFNCFPNPTKNNVTIEFTGEIFLYGMNGTLISQIVSNGLSHLELNQLPAGLYVLKAINFEGQYGTKLLIKE